MSENYINLMNKSIKNLFRNALHISFKDPSLAVFIVKTIIAQNRAAKLREQMEQNGIHVPPFMIVSITKKCNLRCQGCYAQAQPANPEQELSMARLKGIMEEARELGTSIALIAGGEPLTRPEFLDLCGAFPEIIFPFFTNGLLIQGELSAKIRRFRNLVPVISLEGYEDQTDRRRGEGVYRRVLATMAQLKRRNIFFGTSLTITRQNFGSVTEGKFLSDLVDQGCKIFFFVEYVPVEEGTDELVLTDEQRKLLPELMVDLRRQYPALFIAFPGDEEAFGGCLAAGRGFVHINPEGNLEPCPFAPYTDTNLANLSLKEALNSELLKAIRENHDQLTETKGGCALWEHREWVKSLIKAE